MSQWSTNELRAIKHMLERDGVQMFRYFFPLREGHKAIVNWHHYVIDYCLELVLQNKVNRLIINVPPGYTKCLVKGTLVDGVKVEDLKPGDKVHSYKDGKLVKRKIVATEAGSKRCVELMLYSGKSIRCSYDHPILTQHGWVNAEDLTQQHSVKRLCTEIDGEGIDDAELDLVTLMLFEGGTSNPDGKNIRFTSADPEVVKVLRNCCSKLRIGIGHYASSNYDYHLQGGVNGNAANILKKYGLIGHSSTQKMLPKQFYNLSMKQKYRFVSLMIATDGFVTANHAQVGITLASEGLIDGISHILDTMGIPSSKYYRDNDHAGAWTLIVSAYHSKKLLGKIDCLHKQSSFERLVEGSNDTKSLKFGYPNSITKGITYKCKEAGINLKYGRLVTDYCYERILKEVDPSIERFNDRDFIWDAVESVKDIGTKKVVHVQVKAKKYDNQNFLAENIVVHNTEIAVLTFIMRGLAINPRARFIHASYSSDLALENSSKIKDGIESEEYQELWPMNIRLDKKGKKRWFTNKGGGMMAAAAGGQITGFRAGRMEPGFTGAFVLDDPVKPKDAYSAARRNVINKDFNSTMRSRLAKDSLNPFIVIMQRIHADDLTGYLLRGGSGDKWHHLSLPANLKELETTYPKEYTSGIPLSVHDILDAITTGVDYDVPNVT